MIPDQINNSFLYDDTLWDPPFNNCVSRARQTLEILPNKDQFAFIKFFIETDSYFLEQMRSIRTDCSFKDKIEDYKNMINKFYYLIGFDAHVLDIKAYY